MRQYPYHAYLVFLMTMILWMLSCTDTVDKSAQTISTYENPADLIADLRKHPARTLQRLHTDPHSIEKDALLLNTVEQFPRRSKPLCSILSTKTGVDRCLRLTERPHLWKKQPHHFAKSTHQTSLERNCTVDPHPNTCWTAQALLDSKQDWILAEDACRQIRSELWQAECFFTLAESIEVQQENLTKALRICSYSNQFQKSCWMHIIVHLAQQTNTPIDDASWLENTYMILQESSVLPEEMKRDLWQHLLAKMVATHMERGSVWSDITPPAFTGHWQNQYAIETLRWCDIPIQSIEEWIPVAKNIRTIDCKRLSEPRGMDLESDLWLNQIPPQGCETISFTGQSHRIQCPNDDTLNWHMALLETSVRLRPNNPIFVQESLNSDNHVIRKRAEALQEISWQETPDQRK